MSKKEIVELAETPSIKASQQQHSGRYFSQFHAMEPNLLVIPGIMLFLYKV